MWNHSHQINRSIDDYPYVYTALGSINWKTTYFLLNLSIGIFHEPATPLGSKSIESLDSPRDSTRIFI